MVDYEQQVQARTLEFQKIQAGKSFSMVLYRWTACPDRKLWLVTLIHLEPLCLFCTDTLPPDLTATIEARQKLDYQLSESDLVNKELQSLKGEHTTIYKLVGPGLVEQDPQEAKTTVEKRLAFIRQEIERIERKLKELGEAAEKKRGEVIKLQADHQQRLQQQQQQQAK